MFGKLAFIRLSRLFFLAFDPSTLRGCNFLSYILFMNFFSVLDAPIKRVQALFGHQKQWSLPLKYGLP
jgi:hypothetical protein